MDPFSRALKFFLYLLEPEDLGPVRPRHVGQAFQPANEQGMTFIGSLLARDELGPASGGIPSNDSRHGRSFFGRLLTRDELGQRREKTVAGDVPRRKSFLGMFIAKDELGPAVVGQPFQAASNQQAGKPAPHLPGKRRGKSLLEWLFSGERMQTEEPPARGPSQRGFLRYVFSSEPLDRAASSRGRVPGQSFVLWFFSRERLEESSSLRVIESSGPEDSKT